MTVGEMRMVVLLRDHRCVAPLVDPDCGPCYDRWGEPLRPGMRLSDLEMDYVRHGATGARHELASDHVMLCPGHHRGTGPNAGGRQWATSHRPQLRRYLQGLARDG